MCCLLFVMVEIVVGALERENRIRGSVEQNVLTWCPRCVLVLLTLVENPGRWESIIVGQVVLLSYYGFGFRSVGVYSWFDKVDPRPLL